MQVSSVHGEGEPGSTRLDKVCTSRQNSVRIPNERASIRKCAEEPSNSVIKLEFLKMMGDPAFLYERTIIFGALYGLAF